MAQYLVLSCKLQLLLIETDINAPPFPSPLGDLFGDPKRIKYGIMANTQTTLTLGFAKGMAKFITFLIDKETSFVTGAVYNIDSG